MEKSKLTKEDVKSYQDIGERIYEHCHSIVSLLAKDSIKWKKEFSTVSWSIDEWEFNEKHVWINIYESWPYGGCDNVTIDVPNEIFFSENLEKDMEEWIFAMNADFTAQENFMKEAERKRKIEEAKKTLKELGDD